jgi:serine protease DegS
MKIKRTVLFVLQFVTLGLAIAFLVLFLPTLLDHEQEPTVVEIKQADSDHPAAEDGQAVSYSSAVNKAAPAVVNIFTQKVVTERRSPFFDDPVLRRFFGNEFGTPHQRRESSLGSGVIMSAQGYVLTNHHVIADADEIAVALHDGRVTEARVVGSDPDTDLAVVKIDLADPPSITVGRSDTLKVGDVVLAIGNPFGVGQTVTSGIVSALGRNSLGINTFENFIQTDAAINPGNSGGALINAKGNLVGINSAIFSNTGGSMGIGFAIPINLAKDVMTQIIEHGKVVRGWLGIAIQDMTPALAESFGVDTDKGVVVTNIIRNGPADKAGLDRGDIITRINQTPVNNVRETLNAISSIHPGKTVVIELIRNGKHIQKRAKVIQRPVQQG